MQQRMQILASGEFHLGSIFCAYHARQVNRGASGLREPLRHKKTSRQLSLFLLVMGNLSHDIFQVIPIARGIPLDGTPRQLDALADGIIGCAVSNNDIPPLAKRWNDTGNGGKALSIEDACLGAQVGRNIGFGLHVDVLCSVKLRRPAGADAVGTKSIDGFLFDLLVGIEVVDVV